MKPRPEAAVRRPSVAAPARTPVPADTEEGYGREALSGDHSGPSPRSAIQALAALLEPDAFNPGVKASPAWRERAKGDALAYAAKAITSGYRLVSEPAGDVGCRCHGCGLRYLVDMNVPDDLWVRIGMPSPGGLLCGRCIVDRLEQFGEFDAWALVRVSDDEATVDRVADALAAVERRDLHALGIVLTETDRTVLARAAVRALREGQ